MIVLMRMQEVRFSHNAYLPRAKRYVQKGGCMSTVTYDLNPGQGPNLDRIADSWRYFDDPDATVPVVFEATRHHDPANPEGIDVPIKVVGDVYSLFHQDPDTIAIALKPVENGRRSRRVHVAIRYNHKKRTGQLDWIMS
jgi:hypothetical protein